MNYQNISSKEQAQEIKNMKINLTLTEICNKLSLSKNDVKLVFYKAAVILNDDHSCYPWTT